MKILVTGATGFVGSWLVRKLVEKKHEVYCLVRDANKGERLLGNKVKFVEGDLASHSTDYIKSFGGIEIVYHLAACVKSSKVKEYFEVNYKGTERLFTALNSIGSVKRVVYLSSVAVVGNRKGLPITEESLCKPSSPYGKSKLRGEQEVSKLASDSRVMVVIIRSPIIYGEDQPDTVTDFFKRIASGNITIIGNGANKRSMCYIGNLIDALLLFACDEVILKKGIHIFNVCDKESVSLMDLLISISKIMGKNQLKIIELPFFLSFLARIVNNAFNSVGLNSTALFVLSTVSAYIDCDAKKISNLLGFNPSVTCGEGLSRTAFWLKKNGCVT